MRPIRVRFRCFGPYLEEQTVRFDELAEYGLFLICGETGAGKTTILDAICCALYGSCSGEIRGELEAMRCRQADPEEPTEVEYVFESGGKRYLFYRKLTPRKSRKAEISYNEDYSCCRIGEDGVRIPLLDNAKRKSMNAKAEELIGLNLNQFRQVIVLPQGRFETLLTSRSEDKETILASLFHTERWKTAVDRMADEVTERRAALSQQLQTIRDGLDRLQLSSAEELPAALAGAGERSRATAEAEKAAEAEKNRAQALVDTAREFRELDRRKESLEKARRTAEEDRPAQARLDMARRAEKARKPHDEREQAERELKQTEAELARTETKLKQAEEALRKAEAEKAAVEALAGEQQKRTAELQRLSGLRDIYREIGELKTQAERTKKAEASARKNAEAARAEAEKETEKLRLRMEAWNAAGDAYQEISRAYQAATAGYLAAELEEGKPCPVCGSTSHPKPAALPENARGQKDVEAAEEEVARSRRAYDAQVAAQQNAQEALQAAEAALTLAVQASGAAEGALRHGLEQRDPELDTPEALASRIRETEDAVRAFEAKKEKMLAGHQQAVIARETLSAAVKDRQSRAESLRAELGEKEAAWQRALEETGLGTESQYNAMVLPPEEQQLMLQRLAEHRAALDKTREDLEAQERKLEGKERPEAEGAEQAFREAEARHREAIQARALAEKQLADLAGEAERLTRLEAAVSEKRRTLEEDTAFIGALRGSRGISIQRYVLGVRLGQVTDEANRLLSGIYGGRYRLYRSDDSYGSSRKSGLELEVYDSLSDQRRSVCTLSGGEKFLVALSLAIGLCTVVQNEQRGVSLDAMFIDEGFGSLDRNTLGDALDVLQSVQRGRGLVGIISHVSLLEETIPVKIEISKTPRGSVARTKIG